MRRIERPVQSARMNLLTPIHGRSDAQLSRRPRSKLATPLQGATGHTPGQFELSWVAFQANIGSHTAIRPRPSSLC